MSSDRITLLVENGWPDHFIGKYDFLYVLPGYFSAAITETSPYKSDPQIST